MSSLRQIHSKIFKESGSSFSLKSVSLAVAKRLYSTPASKPKKRRLNPALGFDYVCTSSLAKKKKKKQKQKAVTIVIPGVLLQTYLQPMGNESLTFFFFTEYISF